MASKRKILEHALARLPEDTDIITFAQHEHSIELFVRYPEPKSRDVTCVHCGDSHCVLKDNGAKQTIRHISISGQGSLLTFHKPRFLCKECGHSFYFKPDWVCPSTCISEALRLEIIKLLTSTTHSIAEIARETFTTAYIVRSVMLNCEVDTPPCALPETLCIDEFHILFRQNDFCLQTFFLNEWIRNYEFVECPQLRTAVSTIKQFKDGILNAWHFGKSNALCESLN